MKRSMRKQVCAAVLLAGAVVPALAQESPCRVRPGAVDVDISYFPTFDRAAEPALTYPQQHDVAIVGARASRREIEPALVAAGIG